MIGAGAGQGRLVRLAEAARQQVHICFDGKDLVALEGDTVLTAILMSVGTLRLSDSGPEGRSGFCLMGACQDCWIWQEDGPRLRACSTRVEPGMRLLSSPLEGWPVTHAEKAK